MLAVEGARVCDEEPTGWPLCRTYYFDHRNYNQNFLLVFLGRPTGLFFCCGSAAGKAFADLSALSARYSSLLMVGKKLAIDAAMIWHDSISHVAIFVILFKRRLKIINFRNGRLLLEREKMHMPERAPKLRRRLYWNIYGNSKKSKKETSGG